MHDLAKLLADRISAGLKRKTLTTCSKWAESCRVMGGKDFPGPWRFTYHPWLREMCDSEATLNVGKKSAQMGFTEVVLNRTFFKIDVQGVDCLYVLPAATPDASDFSASRFDPALELSSHLSKLFSDVKNVRHKRAGSANLYVRGSKSRSGLKSIPVGFLVLDEVDEMEQENIPLAFQRQAGQLETEAWAISTPTAPGIGIEKLFATTTQEHFYFKCPGCSRQIELTFPDCLEVTAEDLNDPKIHESRIRCNLCDKTLAKGGGHQKHKAEWLGAGTWIPTHTNRDARGFYINQLYSPSKAGSPLEFAQSVIKARYNPADETELYNSKLGLAFSPEGAKITDAMIDSCRGDYKMGPQHNGHLITMGADIGKWIHFWIDEWYYIPEHITSDLNVESKPRCIMAGKCQNFEDLDTIVRNYSVNFSVVDINPEKRKAVEFANRFWGAVKVCYYVKGIIGKSIHAPKEMNEFHDHAISVDRTSWLDMSMSRFRSRSIALPIDLPLEARTHLKALVRVYQKDADGNPIGKYIKDANDEDHYAHARNYSEIALPFGMGLGISQDITESVF